MLAQRVKLFNEINEKLGEEIIAEIKYDGERCQIHKNNNEVKMYSRGMEEISYQ